MLPRLGEGWVTSWVACWMSMLGVGVGWLNQTFIKKQFYFLKW